MHVQKLHHIAYKCGDPKKTYHFYKELLGLPLTHTVSAHTVPSTGGDPVRYFHFFFELGDGSYIAFFDLADDAAPLPSPNTPPWVNHLAFEMDTLQELTEARERLTAAGIDVFGELDHHIIKSIYFFDPNGIRLELTVRTDEPGVLAASRESAESEFQHWLTEREQVHA